MSSPSVEAPTSTTQPNQGHLRSNRDLTQVFPVRLPTFETLTVTDEPSLLGSDTIWGFLPCPRLRGYAFFPEKHAHEDVGMAHDAVKSHHYSLLIALASLSWGWYNRELGYPTVVQ